MKYTNREGEEIECTVEEYKLLHSTMKGTMNTKLMTEEEAIDTVKKIEKKHPYNKNSEIFWTKEEDNFLKANAPDSKNGVALAKKYMKHFGKKKRTLDALKSRISTMNLVKKEDKKYSCNGNFNNQRDRMRFIQARAKYYMNTYQWNYPKSMMQGIEDYNNNKTTITKNSMTHNEDVMPYWMYLKESEKRQYTEMIKGLIKQQYPCIMYDNVSYLKLNEGEYWNFEMYQNFLTWFILHSKETAKYFNVENNFSVKNNTIIYEA